MESDLRVLRVEVRAQGAGVRDRPLLELSLVLERRPELRFPRMRVSAPDALEPLGDSPASAAAGAEPSAAHPAAAPVLAAGLLLLAGGAILGFFGIRRA